MFLRKEYIVLMLVFSVIASGHAQILDDSTQNIYSPKTVNFILEEDLLSNRYVKHKTDSGTFISSYLNPIDTTIDDFHNQGYVFKDGVLYQNLGNIGTPTYPIFYQPPSSIGKRFGFSSLDVYAFDPDRVKYRDTKSPFSHLTYLQGSKGQQMIDIEFSRNVTPRWNLGIDFRRIVSFKIPGSIDKDRQVSNYNFLAYTRYFNKDQSYQLLFNFTHLHHSVFEYGGIKPLPTDYISPGVPAQDSLFGYEEEQVFLTAGNTISPRSLDQRKNYHLYHEYSITRDRSIQLYHIADYGRRVQRYSDFNLIGNQEFYAQIPKINPDSTNDKTTYRYLDNRVGVKGSMLNLTYRGYVRAKYFNYSQNNVIDKNFNENYVGGSLLYRFNDTATSPYINLDGEYYLGRYFNTGNDYTINAQFNSRFFRAGYKRIYYSPTLVQLHYFGNNFQWDNSQDFTNTGSDNIFLEGKLKLGILTFTPQVLFHNISNYVYFNESAYPQQRPENMQYLSYILNMHLKWRSLNFQTHTRYTPNVPFDYVIKVPSLFTYNRFYFENQIFKKALFIQIGADVSWKSTYKGNYYMPITQQFYLNSGTEFPIKNYTLVDIFLNVLIKRAKVYLKMSHINMAKDRGYFITPYYAGLPRYFEFGIQWSFFD